MILVKLVYWPIGIAVGMLGARLAGARVRPDVEARGSGGRPAEGQG